MTVLKSCTPASESDSLLGEEGLLVAYYRPIADPSANRERCTLYRFSSDSSGVSTLVKPLDFVYLPGDSDIVCINALQDPVHNEYIVGVGFVTDQQKGYLNIYGSSSQEKLSECYLRYSELSCVPLQLTHTYYISPATSELQWAFLLSSGRPFVDFASASSGAHTSSNEAPVRIFAKLRDTATESGDGFDAPGMAPNDAISPPPTDSSGSAYGELNTESAHRLFPELALIPHVTILYMNFMLVNCDSPIRISAFGAEDGWIGVFQTNMTDHVVLRRLTFSHDCPIVHVRLFSQSPGYCSRGLHTSICGYSNILLEQIDLLVCSSFEPAVVYCGLFRWNNISLDNQLILPHSADFDHVTCATVGDFTFDGKCEIVLGTFGQRLLFYQWTPLDDSGDDGPERKLKGNYSLLDQKSLIGPIHCLSPPLHLTDDGLASLAVLTSRGLHIYRHKLDTIMHLLHARLSSLLERASNHT